GLEKIINSLEQAIGLDRVKVIHTNDSRSAMGSHLDRHEHLGKGGIGMEGFRRIVNHPLLREKTFILETPLEAPGDDLSNMEAIRLLRSNGKRHQTIRPEVEDQQRRVRRNRAGQATCSEIRLPVSRSSHAKAAEGRVRMSGKANR